MVTLHIPAKKLEGRGGGGKRREKEIGKKREGRAVLVPDWGERGERQTVIENSPPTYRYALQPKSTHIILKVRKKT